MKKFEGATIGQQIELPFMESVKISFQSLMIRFGRSVITTAGITLGIAFLVSVWAGSEINQALQESKGIDRQVSGIGGNGENSVSPKEIWLIVMSLIVCVVGIANSMLMSVTERFQEIGTMKCLGALDSFVVRLFLLESGFQGLTGALIGAVIGTVAALLTALKGHGLEAVIFFPLLAVLKIMIISSLLGMILAIIGAAFPSWRAAKLPPAEAMRTEI